jgi:CubicO group peptidase (beta-lactamase class C family)
MITTVRVICFTILLSAFPFCASAEDFTDAIHTFLQQRVEMEKRDIGIVVGIVDANGSSIISCGKMDNGTDQEVNGDTLFEIGSITKTFTALLLQDMIERGQMKLDDPVAKYLPASVKMPTRNGKEITLLQLATHTSGLPKMPDNFNPRRADNLAADYTVEKMYAFLSRYKLTRDPGTKWEYSNLGMALLGHVVALKAGTNYESLVVDRICRPLKMDSTRITLTPELKSRFAQGHSASGYAVPSLDLGALVGAGALRSTANDLLKYVSANLGLTPSNLTPLMEKTHVVHFSHVDPETDIGLAWFVTPNPQGTTIIWHGGLTSGYFTFAGLDKTRRRGVVVLSNSWGAIDVDYLGNFLLESEWLSDRRPKETKISSQLYDSYVGQYQRPPDFALRMLKMRQFLLNAPKAAIYIPAGIGLALLVLLLWRAGNFRKRLLILACAVLVIGLLVVLIALVSSHVVQPGIGIRREGERLFAQATGPESWPIYLLLPPGAGELLPESENRFFERLSGIPMTFSRDDRGKVTGLTVNYQGKAFSYDKISDQPPKAPEPTKRPVAINLDTKLLDAVVGHYEQAPCAKYPAGATVTIWREGDQLFCRISGKNAPNGTIEIYPESETNFFNKLGGAMTFVKNDKGEVTAVIFHTEGYPDIKGKKLKNLSE